MAGGAIMITDMFNNGLKARVDALCNELSALICSEPDFVAAASFQSQIQGANGNLQRRSSSLLEAEGPDQSNWWPADLGVPSSLGAQNEVRYAYFPAARRLAVDLNGRLRSAGSRSIALVVPWLGIKEGGPGAFFWHICVEERAPRCR
jgi:hypothetical protein